MHLSFPPPECLANVPAPCPCRLGPPTENHLIHPIEALFGNTCSFSQQSKRTTGILLDVFAAVMK